MKCKVLIAISMLIVFCLIAGCPDSQSQEPPITVVLDYNSPVKGYPEIGKIVSGPHPGFERMGSIVISPVVNGRKYFGMQIGVLGRGNTGVKIRRLAVAIRVSKLQDREGLKYADIYLEAKVHCKVVLKNFMNDNLYIVKENGTERTIKSPYLFEPGSYHLIAREQKEE